MNAPEPLLQMSAITKSFGGNPVLRSVDFQVAHGEVHALVGQNGAGKSSLMKVLAGVYMPDAGEVRIEGAPLALSGPSDAHDAGIRMVFQEFSLVPSLTVTQNVVLAQEPRRRALIDERRANHQAQELFEGLGVTLDVRTPVGRLRAGDRQMVEIAKALYRQPKILVLDEPTATLTRPEVDRLFSVVRRLRDNGLGIVFISHHMDEIEELCDRVTVLRDGERVGDLAGADVRVDEVIRVMLPDGQDPELIGAPRDTVAPESRTAAPLLTVSHLTVDGAFQDVSFEMRTGEILGVAGLLGSGTSEVLETIYGLASPETGRIDLAGRPYRPTSPRSAIRRGVALVAEDRRTTGVIIGHTLAHNLLTSVWRAFSRIGWIRDARARKAAREFVARLKVRASGIDQSVETLSGGNQQKVLVGRALLTDPRVVLLHEPTTGIDLAARADIAGIVRHYVDAGAAALWLSSDMRELADVCDRVLVFRRGRLVQTITSPTEPQLVSAIQQAVPSAR